MAKRMNNEEYQQKFKDRWQGQQECLSIYTLSSDIGAFKCLDCGNIRYVAFSEALSKHRCLPCAHKKLREKILTPKQVDESLRKSQGNLFKYVDGYSTSKEPFHAECTNCHSILYYTLRTFKRMGFCPKCTMNKSKGELFLQRLLDFNNIRYDKEKSFDNPINQTKQRMDFFIPQQEICIEYQGEGHFDKNCFQYRGDDWQADIDKKDYLQGMGISVLYVYGDDDEIINKLREQSPYFDNFRVPPLEYIKTHHAPMKDVINDLKAGLSFEEIYVKYQITRKMIQKYIKLTGHKTLDSLLYEETYKKNGFNSIEDVAQWLRFHTKDDIISSGLGEKPTYKRVIRALGFSGLSELRRGLLTQEDITEYRKNHTTRETASHFRVNEPWLRQSFNYK